MPHATRRLGAAALAVLLAAVLMPTVAAAQTGAAGRPDRPSAPVTAAATGDPAVGNFDAERVREQFYEVLERHPPSLGRVLKLDPSLMANDAYLAAYPGVGLFLGQHPEIVRDPAYFLERISAPGFGYESESTQRRREIEEMLAAFAAFLVFLVVTGVVIWLVRTVIETRRWNRMSKTYAEVHTKLLDRFTANEDLLAYIQTPVGRRFLESGPAPLAEDARPIAAPFSRILLTTQAGIVLAVVAVGMLFLSRRMEYEVAQFLLVIGVVTLAAGAGFLASSAAAWVISGRLGLLNRSGSGHE